MKKNIPPTFRPHNCKNVTLLILFICTFLFSCVTDREEFIIQNNDLSSIEIQCYLCPVDSIPCNGNSLEQLPEVNIQLFIDSLDRELGINELISGTTDQQGLLILNNINPNTIYLKAQIDSFFRYEEKVLTANSKAFIDIVFSY